MVTTEKEMPKALLERAFHIMERMDNDLTKVRVRIKENKKHRRKDMMKKAYLRNLKLATKY